MMTRTDVKQKLRRRELTIGSWLTLSHPSIAEILGQIGFDWLVIDLEHTAIDFAEVQQLIQVIELTGSVPLVRVGENRPALIQRVLDLGAHGVVVPLVNSRAEAEAVVRAVRYPPVGTRGVGLNRAQGYGARFEDYRDRVEKESIVIAQIEHIRAVKQFEEIASVEGVDGFLVGPYDLSASMGKPGAFDDLEVRAALDQVQRAAKQAGVSMGIHVITPEPQLAVDRLSEGFTFMALCFDAMFLGQSARTSLKAVWERVAARKKGTPRWKAHVRAR